MTQFQESLYSLARDCEKRRIELRAAELRLDVAKRILPAIPNLDCDLALEKADELIIKAYAIR